jgi:hypothetical protein
MNSLPDKQLAEAEAKLVALLLEAKEDPGLFARIQAWVARMCQGRTLSDYIHDAQVPQRDRLCVARALVDILIAKSYERLPEVALAADSPARPTEPTADLGTHSDSEPPSPEPISEALRALIRAEIRRENANLFERIAHALRDSKD